MNLSVKVSPICEFYIFTLCIITMSVMWVQILHELYLFFRLIL